jgi:hypothetical protein
MMSDDENDKSLIDVKLPDLPGTHLEKAAGEVITDAGKSLVAQLARIMNAAVSPWVAKKEAQAEAIQREIQTNSKIDQDRALVDASRRRELEEMEHQAKLYFGGRRLRRLFGEMAREQENFEAIGVQSLKLIEHAADSNKARQIDDDWMFNFARHAGNVSDEDVRTLWAHVLASAGIEGRTKLSPAALQIISLLDHRAAIDFKNFVRVDKQFSLYPSPVGEDPQDIHLAELVDLGLIHNVTNMVGLHLPDFHLTSTAGGMMGFSLSSRGSQIADVVFDSSDVVLDVRLQEKYLQWFIANGTLGGIAILSPRLNDGSSAPYSFAISSGAAAYSVTSPAIADEFLKRPPSAFVTRLTEWSKARYVVRLMTRKEVKEILPTLPAVVRASALP